MNTKTILTLVLLFYLNLNSGFCETALHTRANTFSTNGYISASHFQEKVDSLARSIDNKIALKRVCSDSVDTLGLCSSWTYRYTSIDSPKFYYFHTTLDSVVFDSSSYFITVGSSVITRNWIDSDSALALAEEQGGRDFRAQHPNFQITASLTEGYIPPALTEWHVAYRSLSDPSQKFDILINAAQSSPVASDLERPETLPKTPVLFQNYPNPFNPETTIAFQLPRTARVGLTIFNTLGEKVIQLLHQSMSAGRHNIRWNGCDANGRNVPSGVYFYRLETGAADGFVDIGKMLLTK